MTRNLKALGLALVASLAMGAIAASAAQATFPAQLTAEAGTTTIDGEQVGNVPFTRSGRTTQCAKFTLNGPAANGATELTLTPTYENCSAVGLGPETITMNGCHYKFTLTADAADTFTARTDLVCPVGKEVEIHLYSSSENHTKNIVLCTYNYPPQSNLGTIDLTNEPAGGVTPKDWILAHLNITGLTSVKKTGSVLLCGAEHDAAGALHGTVKLKGTDINKNITGITISTK